MKVFLRRKKEPKEQKVTRPTNPVTYPTGLALRTEDKEVFFVKDKSLLKFYSDRVFQTWGLNPVETSYSALANYEMGRVLGFRDGTLIHNYADGKVYLISATKRRLIASPEAMDKLGLTWDRLVYASNAETNLHKEGEPIE